MGRTGTEDRQHPSDRRGPGPGRQGVRAAAQAEPGRARGRGDPQLPGLDPGAPVGARDGGQPGCGARRGGPRRGALRTRGGQGADTGPHRGALAGGEAAGTDPVSGGAAGGGEDIAGAQHRAVSQAGVRAGEPWGRPRRGRDPRPPPHVCGRAARPRAPGDPQERLAQPGLPPRRGGQAGAGFPRGSRGGAARGPRSRTEPRLHRPLPGAGVRPLQRPLHRHRQHPGRDSGTRCATGWK